MLDKIVKGFLAFLPYVKIRSKDKGIIPFTKPYWGQKRVLREIAMSDKERIFVILKARQLGMTTLLSVFDLYYAMILSGVKSAIMFASYKDAYRIRHELTLLYDLLPPHKRTLLTSSNREAMRFSNASEIYFLYTSNRGDAKGMAGRGNSFNYLHASEVAFFKSWEDFYTIQSALSDTFPYRLYLYESTANGYNEFYELWETAKRNPVMKAIFIGWWSKDDNRLPKTDEFADFFIPLNPQEKAWVKKIKAYYGVELSMEQWAWWRYQLHTKFNSNEIYCLQELPHTEDEAFQLSGSKFFPSLILSEMLINSKKIEPVLKAKLWVDRESMYISYSDSEYNLLIYEYPEPDGFYVIGADPTMGANPDSDNAVISVFRAYKDKCVQVAEFCDNQVPPQLFARILLFLAGFYNGALVNLEVNGPGRVVLFEIDELRKRQWKPSFGNVPSEFTDKIRDGIQKMREYLYTRPDSLARSFVRHWATTGDTKAWLMEQLRGALHDKTIEVLSEECIKEMQTVIKDGTYIGADSGMHDDRVIACALGYEAWKRYGKNYVKMHSTDIIDQEKKKALKEIKVGNIVIPI